MNVTNSSETLSCQLQRTPRFYSSFYLSHLSLFQKNKTKQKTTKLLLQFHCLEIRVSEWVSECVCMCVCVCVILTVFGLGALSTHSHSSSSCYAGWSDFDLQQMLTHLPFWSVLGVYALSSEPSLEWLVGAREAWRLQSWQSVLWNLPAWE